MATTTAYELQPGETEAHFLDRLRAISRGSNVLRTDPVISTLQSKFAGQLHSASVAINQAKTRNDPVGVRNLIPVFNLYLNRYVAVGADSYDVSRFQLTLQGWSDWLAKQAAVAGTVVRAGVDAAKKTIDAAGEAPGAVVDFVKVLPWLIGGVLVVAGVGLYKGSLSVSR